MVFINFYSNCIINSRIYFSFIFFREPRSNKKFYWSIWDILSNCLYHILQILQVIITPFSHYTISIAGGFIFGTWQGFIYNWIGRVIGTAIAFYLGRYLGRKIIKHVIKPKTIKKYDHYFEKGKPLLFLAYFLPFFPDDELSYLAGFSAISPKIFLPLMVVGHICGSLALAYLGNGIQSIKEPAFLFLSLITLIGGLWFVWYYKKIKNKTINNK